MNDILNLVVTHKDVLIAAAGVVWEIVVRIYPSAKDLSIVNFGLKVYTVFKRIVDAIPNKALDGQLHK